VNRPRELKRNLLYVIIARPPTWAWGAISHSQALITTQKAVSEEPQHLALKGSGQGATRPPTSSSKRRAATSPAVDAPDIRLAIVDDQQMVLSALQAWLEQAKVGISVVIAVPSWAELISDHCGCRLTSLIAGGLMAGPGSAA